MSKQLCATGSAICLVDLRRSLEIKERAVRLSLFVIKEPRAYAQHKLGVYGGYAHNNSVITGAFCDRGSQKNRPGQAINYVQSAVVLLG